MRIGHVFCSIQLRSSASCFFFLFSPISEPLADRGSSSAAVFGLESVSFVDFVARRLGEEERTMVMVFIVPSFSPFWARSFFPSHSFLPIASVQQTCTHALTVLLCA